MAQQHDDSWRDLDLGGVFGAASAEGRTGMNERERRRRDDAGQWGAQNARVLAPAGRRDKGAAASEAAAGADRWANEQLFEKDVRSVLMMMRPHRPDGLLGWSEYRTGGAHFRATVSWDEAFEVAGGGRGRTLIPNIADVLEAVLVGSARHDDDLVPAEEFEIYRGVLRELYRRLDDMQSCYE